jgi:hypothetical protein
MTIKLIEDIKIGKPAWYSIQINNEYVTGFYDKDNALACYEELRKELLAPKKYGTNILKEEEITLPLNK